MTLPALRNLKRWAARCPPLWGAPPLMMPSELAHVRRSPLVRQALNAPADPAVARDQYSRAARAYGGTLSRPPQQAKGFAAVRQPTNSTHARAAAVRTDPASLQARYIGRRPGQRDNGMPLRVGSAPPPSAAAGCCIDSLAPAPTWYAGPPTSAKLHLHGSPGAVAAHHAAARTSAMASAMGTSLTQPTDAPAHSAVGMLAAAMAARARLRAAKHALIVDRLGCGISAKLQRAIGGIQMPYESAMGGSSPSEATPGRDFSQAEAVAADESYGMAPAQSAQLQQPPYQQQHPHHPPPHVHPRQREHAPAERAAERSPPARPSSSGGGGRLGRSTSAASALGHHQRPASAAPSAGEASLMHAPAAAAGTASGVGAPATSVYHPAACTLHPAASGGGGAGSRSPDGVREATAKREGGKRGDGSRAEGRPTPSLALGSVVTAAAAANAMCRGGGSTTNRSSRQPSYRRSNSSPHLGGGSNSSEALVSHGYLAQSPIAAGAFSTIVRAVHRASAQEVAVKTFLMKSKGGKAAAALKDVTAEVDALKRLQESAHVHIANLIETFQSEFELHAILEYCGGGSVQRFLSGQGHGVGLDERDAAILGAQVGCALAHMHGLGVTHRDVKPANLIFVDRSRAAVRLVDFGFAACSETKSSRLRTQCGSPAYMAPELIANKPYLGPPVDCWALGTLMYELIHNKIAFRGESMGQLHNRIRKAAHAPFAPEISSKAKAVVKSALTADPEVRADAEKITRSLIDGYDLEIAAMPP